MYRGVAMNNCEGVTKRLSLILILKQVLFLSVLLFSSNNTLAILSLSVTTQMYIHGNAPEIQMSGESKVLNGIQLKLNVPNSDPLIINPGTSNELSVAFDTSPSMFSFDVDFSAMNNDDIIDVDGDYLGSSNNFKVESVTAEWRDKNNNLIAPDSTASLGGNICKSEGYKGDSTLKLTFSISAKTQYGTPAESQPKEVSKTFTVKANDGICYIRPGVLAVNTLYPTGWPEGDNNAWWGSNVVNLADPFDSNQFVKGTGFIASAVDASGNHFPSTAFPYARFRIVPVNSISQYTYKILKNPNSSLKNVPRSSVADSKSEFIFTNNVPSKGDKFVIQLTNTQTNATFFYQFSIQHWFYVHTGNLGFISFYDAESLCRNSGDRLPTRAELTNSPLAYDNNTNTEWYLQGNGYKRAIGKSLMGEWGKIFYYAPINGDLHDMMAGLSDADYAKLFNYDFYFTNELTSVVDSNGFIHRYSVGSSEGNVIVEPDSAYTMCTKY